MATLEKPFSLSLLKVHIEAILKAPISRVLTYGGTGGFPRVIQPALAGQAISMNAKGWKSWNTCSNMRARPGPALRSSMPSGGDGGDSIDRVIDVYIKELRKKLESWTVSLRYTMHF